MNNFAFAWGQAFWIAVLICMAGCSSPAPKPTPSPTVTTENHTTSTPAKKAGTTKSLLQEAAAKPSAPLEGEDWQPMFDGNTLTGWRMTEFAGAAEVQCEAGLIVLNTGSPFTGINWTNDFPKMNFEVALDAMRVTGSDFFCGLTVPAGDSFCSLIVGGWGGSLLGISSLDRMDASENETTKYMNFEQGKWYRLRLRITEKRIEVWVDAEKLVNVDTSEKKLSLRPGDIELSKPFGIAAWQTTSALRGIKMRRVDGPAGPLK